METSELFILKYQQGGETVISYEPLWKTMEDRGVSQYKLIKSGIDNKTLDSLKKSKNITVLTLEKLCRILDCTPNDIIKFTDEYNNRCPSGCS